MKATYFIHNRPAGVADTADPLAESHAFFCTTCGDIWARIVVEGGRPTFVHQVACERHLPHFPSESLYPGSLLATILPLESVAAHQRPRTLFFIPLEVLKWEFQVCDATLRRQEQIDG